MNIKINISDDSKHLYLLEALSKTQDGHYFLLQIMNHFLKCNSPKKAQTIHQRYLSNLKIDIQEINELPWMLIEFIYKQGCIKIADEIGSLFLLRALVNRINHACLDV